MERLDVVLYDFQLHTHLAYYWNFALHSKKMDINAFILRRTKDQIKKKIIDKELSNVFKHHFGIKSDPANFLKQWHKMYEKYQVTNNNTKRFFGQTEISVLQQLVRTINADENRPYFFFFEDVDINTHQARIAEHGYIHIPTDQSDLVDNDGWLTGDLAVDIGGTKLLQMHGAFELLNCVGITFKFTTNFSPLPKVNRAFFEPKIDERNLTPILKIKAPEINTLKVSLPKAA